MKIELDRPSVYPGLILEPARNGSKTGPAFLQVEFWICLDPFQTGTRTVPCKQKPIRSGSVQFRMVPVQTHVCSLIVADFANCPQSTKIHSHGKKCCKNLFPSVQ